MEICNVLTPTAPRLRLAELPGFTEAHPARDDVPSATQTVTQLYLHAFVGLSYSLETNILRGLQPHIFAFLSVRVVGTFAVRGTPRAWSVVASTPRPLGVVLSSIHSMLRWSMSGTELALWARSGDEYRRVMTQCAVRCALTGEPYRGEESLRRVDWLRGHTRLVGLAWRPDVQAWLLDLSA